MKVMRGLVVLVLLSAAARLAGLGSGSWQDAGLAAGAGVAAQPPTPGRSSDETAPCDVRGFRDLLETVQKRAQDLDQRDAALRAREAGLAAVRRAVGTEITRLEGVARALGVTPGAGSAPTIAKVYETMQPEDAAPILDRLDDATLRAVLGRMRDRQVGAILAAMNRDRAVAVTKALAAPAVTAAGSRP